MCVPFTGLGSAELLRNDANVFVALDAVDDTVGAEMGVGVYAAVVVVVGDEPKNEVGAVEDVAIVAAGGEGSSAGAGAGFAAAKVNGVALLVPNPPNPPNPANFGAVAATGAADGCLLWTGRQCQHELL